MDKPYVVHTKCGVPVEQGEDSVVSGYECHGIRYPAVGVPGPTIAVWARLTEAARRELVDDITVAVIAALRAETVDGMLAGGDR